MLDAPDVPFGTAICGWKPAFGVTLCGGVGETSADSWMIVSRSGSPTDGVLPRQGPAGQSNPAGR